MVSLRGSSTGVVFSKVCSGSYPNGNVATDKFSIDDTTGRITLIQSVDYEVKDTYAFVVRVTDSGALFSDAYIVIRIVDVNEPMAFPNQCLTDAISTSCMAVPENSIATTVVGTHTGTDYDAHVTCTSSRPDFDVALYPAINYGGTKTKKKLPLAQICVLIGRTLLHYQQD